MTPPPRNRRKGNEDLPANLYQNGEYFRYRNPVTREWTSLNVSREEAIEKARVANEIIEARKIDRLVSGMSGQPVGIRMHAIIADFELQGLPRLELAPSTLREHQIKLRRWADDFGDRRYRDCTLAFWNEYLEQFPADGNAYVKHRGLAIHLYRFAIARGIEGNTTNHPELTLTGMKQQKRRQPITSEQLDAILAHPMAEEWFRRIIAFDRRVLFRRSDLVGVRRKDVDTRRRSVKVEVSKTLNYSSPIYLDLELPDDAWEIARDSLADTMHTPFLFWYRPRARGRDRLKGKPHWTYITPDHLSKTFAKIRNATGLFDQLEPAQRPTLHEVRGLGSRELRNRGADPELIQMLMGHSREETTQLYLDDGKPVYNQVSLRA